MCVNTVPNGKKLQSKVKERRVEKRAPGNEKEPKQVQNMLVFQNTPVRGLYFVVVNFEQKTVPGIPSCFP
jgi:hypothetical protein